MTDGRNDGAECFTFFYNFANALLETGRKAEALTEFERALEIQPDYANAFHNRAVALRKLSKTTDAEADEPASDAPKRRRRRRRKPAGG